MPARACATSVSTRCGWVRGASRRNGWRCCAREGMQVYAEFNTLHVADYLKEHPDAAPIGADGRVSPPPQGWQGICPTHEAYRRFRMDAFRKLLQDFAIDGVWLDYHHGHASWERADPDMPDTCFCDRCLRRFQEATAIRLPDAPASERAALLLSTHRTAWSAGGRMCSRIGSVSSAPSSTRHGRRRCSAPSTTHGGRRRRRRATGEAGDRSEGSGRLRGCFQPDGLPRAVRARGGPGVDLTPGGLARKYLGVTGAPGERHRIWPIVQISDWGEPVPVQQVATVLERGGRRPASGVIVFAWSGLRESPRRSTRSAARSAPWPPEVDERHRDRTRWSPSFCDYPRPRNSVNQFSTTRTDERRRS